MRTSAPPNPSPLREEQASASFYKESRNEKQVFRAAFDGRLPLLLTGPTGCGKTRLVEHMAEALGRPLFTVSCHDDLSASDLVGRYLIRREGTVWQDGPLTRAVREGAICYLDEVVEARQDTVVVLHSLSDYRRVLPIDKTGELVPAAAGFLLVISYNPGYQRMLKDLKPSTRQRFVALDLAFPPPELETRIVAHEGGVEARIAGELVSLAGRLRQLRDRGLPEVPSTRLLVLAARLIASGVTPREACRTAVAAPLTDDPELVAAIHDVIDAVL